MICYNQVLGLEIQYEEREQTIDLGSVNTAYTVTYQTSGLQCPLQA